MAETKKKEKLIYPAIPTKKSDISQTYIEAYLTNEESATEEQAAKVAAAYDAELEKCKGDSAKYVKATAASVNVFCSFFFPQFLEKKVKKEKLTFSQRLRAIKK